MKEINEIIALCQWGLPYDYGIEQRWGHELA